MNRNEPFATGEYYHCYNRGVDKRVVFKDAQDFDYFLKAVELFNQEDSLGGMMEYKYPKNAQKVKLGKTPKLVNVFAYCLNPNHFHLVLQPNSDIGVQKFMQKVGTGYTMYFNKKYERTGSLFQGRYKSSYVDSDQYLKHLLAYVSLNNKVHQGIDHKNFRSSLHSGGKYKDVFDNTLIKNLFGSPSKFKAFAEDRLSSILNQKEQFKELKNNLYLE